MNIIIKGKNIEQGRHDIISRELLIFMYEICKNYKVDLDCVVIDFLPIVTKMLLKERLNSEHDISLTYYSETKDPINKFKYEILSCH